jgi:MSHA biogenesis protein MshO
MHRGPEVVSCRPAEGGFTLVEMIVSIVISGIVLAMVALFGRTQINAYIDVGNRAELADAADSALRRIGRDLQAALPNSVRVDTSGKFLEYVPISDAGRYRADVGGGASDDPLDFGSSTDSSFDVLGPTVSIASGEQLVIFNLGQSGSDVYAGIVAGSSRRAATAGTNLSSISFTPGGTQFPLASPQSRFQIVAPPVTYQCAANASSPESGTMLRRTGYGFSTTQPTSFSSGTSPLLVGDVESCSFSYLPAALQRNGLVVIRLKLTRNSESVELLHQVEVMNTP